MPAPDVLINATLRELITRRGWGTKTYSQKVTMTTCLNRSVSTNKRRLWQTNYNNRESARDIAYIENNRPAEYDGGHKRTQMLEVKEIALSVS